MRGHRSTCAPVIETVTFRARSLLLMSAAETTELSVRPALRRIDVQGTDEEIRLRERAGCNVRGVPSGRRGQVRQVQAGRTQSFGQPDSTWYRCGRFAAWHVAGPEARRVEQ